MLVVNLNCYFMRHLFNYPLGACSAPFGFSKKEITEAAALLIGSGISAAASAGTAAMNNYAADLRSDRQFYRTQDLMQYQTHLNMQQWQEQQDYNSPAAQMQRYKEAGLNPWLMSKSDLIGSGSSPAAAPSTSAPSVPLGQYAPLDMSQLGGNVAQLLGLSSQIKRNDAESLSKIVESISKVGPDLGWDVARNMANDLLGVYGVSGSQSERKLNAIIDGLESEARSKSVKASLDEAFGVRDANQKWALGEQALSESFARIGKMSSDAKVNEATVKELASQIVRNVADAWKLRKEGEKYLADSKTANALREFVVSQARSQAQQLKLSSFMNGADPASPIHDYKFSKGHVKSVISGLSITDEQYSSELLRAMDKVFGEYVKVSNAASPAYNFDNSIHY